jgi:predicted PurR-regulated permease PerM
VVWLVRSALEPRLVGKELGLDSLVTLLSVYGGLKLFGFPGMLLVPIGVMGVLRGIRGLRSGTQ